ncbi:unnamed protein product [Rotaria sp. Silwood2]|nr:unnamed protein product [Rotaria sp. Silwood2]
MIEFILQIYNLSTGKDYSMLEMIKALEKALGKIIAYKECLRQPSDLASVYADSTVSAKELRWKVQRGLDDMGRYLWRWQSNNPNEFQ